MDSLVSLPANIVDWLSQREELEDISFFTEFPPISKAVPLKKAIVAVGIEEMKIVDKFVENADHVLERQEYCRTANIKARLSICVPYSFGGNACHDIFTRIINQLTFNTSLNIKESFCDVIDSDRNTSALVMNGFFNIESDFCPAEEVQSSYYSFFDKELLCGSHIRNNAIHMNEEEKQLLNEPHVNGFYFGNGAASHSFTLGFEPKIVIVFCPDYPPVTADFTAKTMKVYYAVATQMYSSLGLTLTSNGFKVTNDKMSSSTAALNATATTYCYIAFK